MSQTGVTVLGAGLPKISILNILLAQSPLFEEHAFPKHSSRASQQRWVCLAAFQLAGMHLFGVIRRTVFGVFRRTVFGVFRRFSAFSGVFRRFSAHARGEINRAFFACTRRMFRRVAGGGVTTLSNGLDFGASRAPKTSVVQTELPHRKRRV